MMSELEELKAKWVKGGKASDLEFVLIMSGEAFSATTLENAAAELARLQAIEAAAVETNRTLRLTARHMHELARRHNEPGHSTDYFDTCQFPACQEVAALLARK